MEPIQINKIKIVSNFPEAKVKFMQGYRKPYIRKENPDHIILHFTTNEFNSEKRNMHNLSGNQLLI